MLPHVKRDEVFSDVAGSLRASTFSEENKLSAESSYITVLLFHQPLQSPEHVFVITG